MIKYTLLSTAVISSMFLSACSSSSSNIPPVQPDNPQINITSITAKLPPECKNTLIYADDTNDLFGYSAINQSSDLTATTNVNLPVDTSKQPLTEDTLIGSITLADIYNTSYDAVEIYLGATNSDMLNNTGDSHMYCFDKNNEKVELSFKIDDANGNQISPNLNLTNDTPVSGPIVLQGSVRNSSHIYLYNGKKDNKTNYLSSSNKL